MYSTKLTRRNETYSSKKCNSGTHGNDVAVISDVEGVNAENVVHKADRTTVAIETGSPRSAQEG